MADHARTSSVPWKLGMLVAVGSACWFADRLADEPFFADESAHVAQSYYYRLIGQTHHVDWVHPAAYDHLPIYKYLIGFAIHRAGRQTPTSLDAIQRWFAGDFSPPDDPVVLQAARVPMLLGAVVGCVMMFGLGRQLRGPKTGLVAAGLLAASPLYYRHARLAMDDCLAMALVLMGFVCLVRLGRAINADRPYWRLGGAIVLGGVAMGLAPATKLSGGIAPLAAALLSALALLVCPFVGSARARLLPRSGLFAVGSALMMAIALATFVAVNPFLYAAPKVPGPTVPSSPEGPSESWEAYVQRVSAMGVLERMRLMSRHRFEGLQAGLQVFPHLALPTIPSRLQAMVVEGLGRWFAGGEATRNGPGIPAGYYCWLVLPGVVLGLSMVWSDGWKCCTDGQVPVGWLLLVWPALEIVLLTRNLTVNFDRYFLGVVTWGSLLVVLGVVGVIDSIRGGLILPPPTEADGALATTEAER